MITEEQQDDAIFELSADLREVGKQILKLLRKGAIEVPLFPKIATDVMRLAKSPDTDAATLADLIQRDTTLAGHVIRVANSPLYTPNASMVSLQQAIARLGLNAICEISLGIALNAKLFNAPKFEDRLIAISQHGFCCAIWAKELARALQESVETAFLCGLLHGIGRPAFLQFYSDMSATQQLKLTPAQVLELEDVFQPLFGQEINKAWEMPEVVCDVALFSQTPSQSEKYQTQCALVQAASLLAKASLEDQDLEPLKTKAIFSTLNLYTDALDDVLCKRDQIVSTVRAKPQ